MKSDHPVASDSSKQTVHRRPVWILLFAALLILTAGVATAEPPGEGDSGETVVQYDGAEYLLPKAAISQQRAAAEAEMRRQKIRRRSGGRPKYATINATLANFDADSTPDGWRVEVMLLDANDQPVSKRAHGTFELMPRMPSAHNIGYVNAKMSPVRWSRPLKFHQGVAEVRLPLRQKLLPVFDRHVTFLPDPGLGTSIGDRRHVVLRRSLESTSRSAFSRDWRYNVGRPESGRLKARISVPTEGVFETVTTVPIRPSVLVDTNWPYR